MTAASVTISPEAAINACARAAEAHAARLPWEQAVHATVRALIDRLAVARGLTAPGLTEHPDPAAEQALDELGPLDDWHIDDLGTVNQLLLELTPTVSPSGKVTVERQDLGRRAALGSWYTPTEIADTMARLSLGPQLDRFAADPDPSAMFDVLPFDPACGAGVFLTASARYMAERIAARVTGTSPPPPAHVRAALTAVLRDCVFGVDIDPVAVDLAKTACWLEINGRQPWTFMDRNIICGNTLEGDLPPAYVERTGPCPSLADAEAVPSP
ncbi:N-6 DNA methylase [Streptomyces sp. NPDC000888]